jgi:hypothetical protein
MENSAGDLFWFVNKYPHISVNICYITIHMFEGWLAAYLYPSITSSLANSASPRYLQQSGEEICSTLSCYYCLVGKGMSYSSRTDCYRKKLYMLKYLRSWPLMKESR